MLRVTKVLILNLLIYLFFIHEDKAIEKVLFRKTSNMIFKNFLKHNSSESKNTSLSFLSDIRVTSTLLDQSSFNVPFAFSLLYPSPIKNGNEGSNLVIALRLFVPETLFSESSNHNKSLSKNLLSNRNRSLKNQYSFEKPNFQKIFSENHIEQRKPKSLPQISSKMLKTIGQAKALSFGTESKSDIDRLIETALLNTFESASAKSIVASSGLFVLSTASIVTDPIPVVASFSLIADPMKALTDPLNISERKASHLQEETVLFFARSDLSTKEKQRNKVSSKEFALPGEAVKEYIEPDALDLARVPFLEGAVPEILREAESSLKHDQSIQEKTVKGRNKRMLREPISARSDHSEEIKVVQKRNKRMPIAPIFARSDLSTKEKQRNKASSKEFALPGEAVKEYIEPDALDLARVPFLEGSVPEILREAESPLKHDQSIQEKTVKGRNKRMLREPISARSDHSKEIKVAQKRNKRMPIAPIFARSDLSAKEKQRNKVSSKEFALPGEAVKEYIEPDALDLARVPFLEGAVPEILREAESSLKHDQSIQEKTVKGRNKRMLREPISARSDHSEEIKVAQKRNKRMPIEPIFARSDLGAKEKQRNKVSSKEFALPGEAVKEYIEPDALDLARVPFLEGAVPEILREAESSLKHDQSIQEKTVKGRNKRMLREPIPARSDNSEEIKVAQKRNKRMPIEPIFARSDLSAKEKQGNKVSSKEFALPGEAVKEYIEPDALDLARVPFLEGSVPEILREAESSLKHDQSIQEKTVKVRNKRMLREPIPARSDHSEEIKVAQKRNKRMLIEPIFARSDLGAKEKQRNKVSSKEFALPGEAVKEYIEPDALDLARVPFLEGAVPEILREAESSVPDKVVKIKSSLVKNLPILKRAAKEHIEPDAIFSEKIRNKASASIDEFARILSINIERLIKNLVNIFDISIEHIKTEIKYNIQKFLSPLKKKLPILDEKEKNFKKELDVLLRNKDGLNRKLNILEEKHKESLKPFPIKEEKLKFIVDSIRPEEIFDEEQLLSDFKNLKMLRKRELENQHEFLTNYFIENAKNKMPSQLQDMPIWENQFQQIRNKFIDLENEEEEFKEKIAQQKAEIVLKRKKTLKFLEEQERKRINYQENQILEDNEKQDKEKLISHLQEKIQKISEEIQSKEVQINELEKQLNNVENEKFEDGKKIQFIQRTNLEADSCVKDLIKLCRLSSDEILESSHSSLKEQTFKNREEIYTWIEKQIYTFETIIRGQIFTIQANELDRKEIAPEKSQFISEVKDFLKILKTPVSGARRRLSFDFIDKSNNRI